LLLGPLAWLLGNMGETEDSKTVYAQGLRQNALDLRASIDYALALLQTGQFRQARNVLAQTQHAPGTDDLRATHEGLLADIDWDLGDANATLSTYTTLWNDPDMRRRMRAYQVERFVTLTQEIHGAAAALVLLPEAWDVDPNKVLALQWLQALVKQPSFPGLHAWDHAIFQGELGDALRQDAQVYAARSQVWQALGRHHEALADLRRAVRLAPDNGDDQIALVWLLLDMNRLGELRGAVSRYAARLLRMPGGQDVLAAAAQALDQLPLALELNAERYPSKQQDALWLINYGDLLTRANQTMKAQAAYAQAWHLLRHPPRFAATVNGKPVTPPFDDLLAALRLSYGRISMRQQQRLIAMLRSHLRETKGSTEEQHKQQADAAIADWLLRLNTTSAARWWLTRAVLTNADRQSIELQIALQTSDQERIRELLDAGAINALSPIDRIETLRAAGRPTQALAQADKVLEQAAEQGRTSPSLQALARQTEQERIELANRSTLRYASQQNDAVMRSGPALEQTIALTPHLRFSLGLSHQSLSTLNPSVITGLPDTWSNTKAGLDWNNGQAQLQGSIGHNTALGSINPLELAAGFKLPGNVNTQLQVQHDAVADESGALLIAGKRDRLELTLSKVIGRFWVGVSQSVSQYFTRSGAELGKGSSAQWQAGVWLRQGEPDLGLKLLGYSNQFSATGKPEPLYARINPTGLTPAASFFIPAGDDAVGVGIIVNQLAADRYSSHWLPFGELDLLRSRRLGNTTDINLGVQGPVWGGDQLSLQYQRQQNTTGLNRQWSIQYRIWFGP
jgi:tetratricopeptide (TPR) repeat protein